MSQQVAFQRFRALHETGRFSGAQHQFSRDRLQYWPVGRRPCGTPRACPDESRGRLPTTKEEIIIIGTFEHIDGSYVGMIDTLKSTGTLL